MSENVKNWQNARILTKVFYLDPNTNAITEHSCTLVNRVTTSNTTPVEPYSSLTKYNNGFFEKPPQYNFTVALPVVSDTASLFRSLQSAGLPFTIEISDPNSSGEFKLNVEVYDKCRLENKAMDITVGNLPMTVFTGKALRYAYNDGNAFSTVNGATVSNTNSFGSGDIPNVNLFGAWQ